jgi:hypothetical protein
MACSSRQRSGRIYDVFVRATRPRRSHRTVTVTMGAPCASAETCLDEQKCVDGRCLWDPPVGELGDECTYPQFCKSLLCRGTAEQSICTQTCEPEDPDGCPPGLACTQGVCYFAQDGGCCSASGGGGWLRAGLFALVVGFVLRRRRRA